MKDVVERLQSYVQGWEAHFRSAQSPRLWRVLNKWMRPRLRAIQPTHCRRGTAIYWELPALGFGRRIAASRGESRRRRAAAGAIATVRSSAR
ncbi:group II intron maturase-specific domain-containing protein [Paraburkholderia aromaticivorans]|uniref:group II intron maturase-specific domain-containing protein n=1 Tax=Paraburkholderia aromaticivorans TaxID=2026199 RepID=UPI0038BAF5DF